MKTKQFNHDNLFSITKGKDYKPLKQVEGFNDVYKHYCDFAKDKKIAYLEEATDYVMEKLNIKDDRENVKTACYYSSCLLRQEKKEKHKDEMIKEGWLELNIDIVKEAIKQNKKLEIKATTTRDWLTSDMSNIYKPFIDNEGNAFLMKPRARSRGFMLHIFENAFCKLV